MRMTLRYLSPDGETTLNEESSAKPPLDQTTIVSTALRLLDEVGLEGLSTRRLAKELGIKSASLYWHFKDKNELLAAMCGAMFDECLLEPNIDGPDFVWHEWLAEGARRIRRTALSRRGGAQIMARPRPIAPTTRVMFTDNVLTLQRSGLSELECKLAFQSLRRYAIGSALQEQATPADRPGGIVMAGEEGFEFGLEAIIEGIKQRLIKKRPDKSAS